MFLRRSSGILLHVTSLPSAYGIGDCGPAAYRFADFLAESGQHFWQILPLNPTDAASQHSPYSVLSAFAADSMFIDPDPFGKAPASFSAIADYERACSYRESIFSKVRADQFPALGAFRERNSYWLSDYAKYFAFKRHFQRKPWYAWPVEIRDRQPEAIESLSRELRDEIEREEVIQCIFQQQWTSLKLYCNQRGVRIIGDLPIYVNHDSCDVWTRRNIFELDANGRPRFVAGVPPDRFSATGQRWGNPVYRWETIKQTGYEWWIERMRRCLDLYDMVRMDHFRGFAQFWASPANESTAKNGRWINGPAYDLFDALLKRFSTLPLIAEDLGTITRDVRGLIEYYGFPGMKPLLFAFAKTPADHPALPHNHISNCVVYTGTHDNNTVRGWFDQEATPDELGRVSEYIGHQATKESVYLDFIRMAMSSVADLAMVPMQDWLGLGGEARMNRPASSGGNWKWRLQPEQLNSELAAQIRAMVRIYYRDAVQRT